MRVNRLQTLAVKRPAAGCAAEGQPHGDWARHFRAPKKRRGLVDNLVETNGGEIRELHFDDRPHAFNRRADGQTDHRVLADGRINHATGKFLRQIFRGLERAAESADILPVNEHARVIAQCMSLRFADGFEIGDAHRGVEKRTSNIQHPTSNAQCCRAHGNWMLSVRCWMLDVLKELFMPLVQMSG